MTTKDVLRPPCGPQVRRLVAVLTLAVGIPRLPVFGNAIVLAYNPLRFMEPWMYGVLMTALGLALFFTSYRCRRLTLLGRVVSALGFTMWIVLAAATASTTSMLINMAVASTMLAEVWAQRGRCSDDS